LVRTCPSGLAVALVTAGAVSVTPARAEAPGAPRAPGGPGEWWSETFDRSPPDFVDPFHHDAPLLSRVYSVQHDGAESYLHARHDDPAGKIPAMHYGHAFQSNPPPLDRVQALKWRWRVLRHPDVAGDPWADVAASVYVVLRTPSLLHGGKGFKFGWLEKPGADSTYQHGLLQVQLRHDTAGPEWKQESVDLCALYRKAFGACEGEHVLYVGVVTDADNTRSVAEADYDDFELTATP
jgi:hypothetical protein